MRGQTLFARCYWALAAVSVLSTIYVYLYPAFHGCAFTIPSSTSDTAPPRAPLRLLALGDPQLEGESSLPSANSSIFPCLHESWHRHIEDGELLPSWLDFKNATWSFVAKDLPGFLNAQRKKLDLWGNDYYLGHIYRTVRWWTEPTHTVVLGDLLGSQWIELDAFHARADRYYGKVFRGSTRVPARRNESAHDLESEVDWTRSIINVAGNHDIGYAGDFDTHRLERFEERFAPLNWDLKFQLDSEDASRLVSAYARKSDSPLLHVVVLNSMNLDAPAYNKPLREETWHYLEEMKANVQAHGERDAVVLLTHIPLFKEEGICVDGPLFEYFPEENGAGVSEQNHLSDISSLAILDGLFASSTGVRAGMVLNGHDHEGCNVLHSLAGAELQVAPGQNVSRMGDWASTVYSTDAEDRLSLHEVTVRSMMGAYGGNAGLVSGWFDAEQQRWRFEYQSCMFAVQHVWWAVHILDTITVLGAVALLFWPREQDSSPVAAAKKNQ